MGSYSWHDQFQPGRLDTGHEEEVPVGRHDARRTDRDGLVLLAYVYQLKMYKKGKGSRPKTLARELPIPADYRH